MIRRLVGRLLAVDWRGPLTRPPIWGPPVWRTPPAGLEDDPARETFLRRAMPEAT